MNDHNVKYFDGFVDVKISQKLGKKRRKHDKIVFWAKVKSNKIEVLLLSLWLILFYLYYFSSINNLLKDHDEIKEEIRNISKIFIDLFNVNKKATV